MVRTAYFSNLFHNVQLRTHRIQKNWSSTLGQLTMLPNTAWVI